MKPRSLLAIIALVIAGSQLRADEPAAPPANPELDAARKAGWELAALVAQRLDASDPQKFTGIKTWLAEFRDATRGIDAKTDPAKWPAFDVDALTVRNPKFWRAYYEIVPGDPGVILLHAGLLLAAGETSRASEVTLLGWQRPGVPKQIQGAFDQILSRGQSAGKRPMELIQAGIKLHDQGDFDGAIKKYQEALKLDPKNGLAHFETGLSLHHKQLKAAGLEPPKPGTVGTDLRRVAGPEAKAAYARARKHDPFQFNAWQGDDQAVIQGALALAKNVMRSVGKMRTDRKKPLTDEELTKFADGCQEAGIHELAIVARQVLAARRGRYAPEDHPFLTTSLRKLAPGEPVEEALKLLNSGEMTVRQIVAPEAAPMLRMSDAFSARQLVLYVAPQELQQRVGDGVGPLADFLKEVNTAAVETWVKLPKGEPQTMMLIVYVKPGKKARYWFTFGGAPVEAKALEGLTKRLAGLTPPAVKQPLAAAWQVDLWGGPEKKPAGPPPDELLFPKEWMDAAKKKGVTLKIPLSDDALEAVWP